MSGTVLTLSGIGVPPYSARGLTQTLEPIDAAAQLRRTVNGALRDFGYTPFRKYRSTISCADQEPPAVYGVWASFYHNAMHRTGSFCQGRPNSI
jgi:hypothetical protein